VTKSVPGLWTPRAVMVMLAKALEADAAQHDHLVIPFDLVE
jgi:hypothetical protein